MKIVGFVWCDLQGHECRKYAPDFTRSVRVDLAAAGIGCQAILRSIEGCMYVIRM